MLGHVYNEHRFKTRIMLIVLLVVLILASSSGQCAQMLGELSFSEVPAMTLDGPHLGRAQVKPANINEAIRSSMYLSSVGGIAFGGVAVPVPGIEVVSLKYNPSEPDGQRLEVMLKLSSGQKQKVRAKIYDWQLLPTAHFAGGESLACFTLFGQLKDSQQQEALLSAGAKILNYHSAFENTLLGLRILQADILILYPDNINLISEDDRPVLGAGEKTTDTAANRDRFLRLQSYRESLSGGPFQSFLICDYEQKVTFGVTNDALELTGWPYWFCWRERIKGEDRYKLQEEANRYANKILNSNLKALAAMSKVEREQRFYRLWDEYVSQRLLQAMPAYSQALSDKIKELDGVNPEVYQALVYTMRYAAFFRHVKQVLPQEWENFLLSIRTVRLNPSPRTPTVMKLPPRYRSRQVQPN